MFRAKIKKLLLALFVCGLPVMALAADATLSSVIANVSSTILSPLVGVLLTAALVVFFWGMVKYINSLASEKDKKDGKDLMVWGIIALFVMISVWGLVRLLQGSFLGGADTTPFETIQMPGNIPNSATDSGSDSNIPDGVDPGSI